MAFTIGVFNMSKKRGEKTQTTGAKKMKKNKNKSRAPKKWRKKRKKEKVKPNNDGQLFTP